MNIRKFATISLLVLSSFAANNVAPSKAELEAMYDKAFREFNANNYPEAMKQLDAIDAREPDLAESQNLRGVIAMRQGSYDQAEVALQKALAADPKFWNARFNLAEIPFLKKDWAEARNRFEGLLFGNKAELQGEALQLIQYKILLTYLLEGKENMVDSILAKLELSPDTPAVHYANAAVAFQRKNEKEAKDWIGAAEKNFSPQLNKLFVESLYEIGWLEKPAGQTRAALELTSATERAAKMKEMARGKFDQAEQAFAQRDFTAARKLVDEAEAADPNQAAVSNLRGEILMAQKDFDGAEAAFKQAQKLDPKFHEAAYNLAQIPFKKKDYTKARDRFEALFSATPASNGEKDQAGQLIRFKIYLTLLLEGKDSRAQKLMEQFQFTSDTPALYYAQAAWEFKHNNTAKANDWVASARRIYSPTMNMVFADAFYDLGWLQNLAAAPAPVVASATTKADLAPAIEPSPIPGASLAMNKASKSSALPVPQKSPASAEPISGMEATTATAERSPVVAASPIQRAQENIPAPAAKPSASVEILTTSAASPAQVPIAKLNEPAPAASASVVPTVVAQASAAPSISISAGSASVAPAVSSTPATVLAPATVREWSQPSFAETMERYANGRTMLVAVLLLAALAILGWVVNDIRRRMGNVPLYQNVATAGGPSLDSVDQNSQSQIGVATRLPGGPRQISLQLKASEPSVRRSAVPFGKTSRPFVVPPVEISPAEVEPENIAAPLVRPTAVETRLETEPVSKLAEAEVISPEAAKPEPAFEPVPTPAIIPELVAKLPDEEVLADLSKAIESRTLEPFAETPILSTPDLTSLAEEEISQPVSEDNFVAENLNETPAVADEIPVLDLPNEMPETIAPEAPEFHSEITAAPQSLEAELPAEPESEFAGEFEEPIGQGQPIPYQISAESAEQPATEIAPEVPEVKQSIFAKSLGAAAAFVGLGSLRRAADVPSVSVPEPISTEPPTQQSNLTEQMPPPNQPTPAIRTSPQTPMTGGAPQTQSAGGMHTAVQLTFSFEIASLQLTPSFKMGALQLRPISKIVTMRLAPSQQAQQAQAAMNLQVTFEVSTVQLAGNSLGTIRLTPSQLQKPTVISSPAFNIASLQLLSGAESGAVQLTPSQQGQASVHVTGRFQIATVEFSPSFEIASLVLNATSKSVAVQLPGAGPSSVEGAPTFDITNVQLGSNSEIAMMQLSAHGMSAPTPA